MICPTCGHDPSVIRPPLELLDEFLLSESRNETTVPKRLLALLLKSLIFLLLMALIALAFFGLYFLLSILMVGFVTHYVLIVLIIVGLFVLGDVLSRIKRRK
jgi:hypothetical protein